METLSKLGAGVALLFVPSAVIGLFGLASSPGGFWPRLAGALLIGLAGASFVEGRFGGAQGLGLAGSVLINLALAFVIIATLVLRGAAPTRRGRSMLGLLAALLLVVSLVEIAFV